jgi:hypothetical protein
MPQRGPQLSDGLAIHGVVDPALILSIALALDQSCQPQDAQVMRDQTQRQAKTLGNLAVALCAFHEKVKNAQPRRIAERLEDTGQFPSLWLGVTWLLLHKGVIRRMVEHALNYISWPCAVKSAYWLATGSVRLQDLGGIPQSSL